LGCQAAFRPNYSLGPSELRPRAYRRRQVGPMGRSHTRSPDYLHARALSHCSAGPRCQGSFFSQRPHRAWRSAEISRKPLRHLGLVCVIKGSTSGLASPSLASYTRNPPPPPVRKHRASPPHTTRKEAAVVEHRNRGHSGCPGSICRGPVNHRSFYRL
jgi:hypothetical protein